DLDRRLPRVDRLMLGVFLRPGVAGPVGIAAGTVPRRRHRPRQHRGPRLPATAAGVTATGRCRPRPAGEPGAAVGALGALGAIAPARMAGGAAVALAGPAARLAVAR